jgi:guanosine-3',5'-bis(diphosphate) 3'-pyrophosphohydrolase
VLTAQQSVGAEAAEATLADHIFVLTPKGDIIELPEGATSLDFAFQIHTDLGLRFRSARVNGAIVPLDYELENGDVVEILSHKTPQPSSGWMQMLKMASSRSRLRRHLHTMDRALHVEEGKNMLNEELRRRHLPLLDADYSLLRRFDDRMLTLEEREDVLAKLGQHSDRVSSVLSRIEDLREELARTPAPKKLTIAPANARPVEVDGGLPMPVRFAKCCAPDIEPHEKILGLISRSGDVMVHRAKCRMLRRVNPERKVNVRWRRI